MRKMPKKAKRAKKRRERKSPADTDRKPLREDRLKAGVQDAINGWHQHEQMLKVMETAANEDPIYASKRLLEASERKQRLYARYIRLRFGLEVRATEGNVSVFVTKVSKQGVRIVGRGGYNPAADLVEVRPERKPRNLREAALFSDLLWEYVVAGLAARAMVEVGGDVWDAGYDDEVVAWIVCQIFLKINRNRFVFSGASTQQEVSPHKRLREVNIAILSGWVGSKISLRKNKTLSAALAEQDGKPFDVLRQELPAATLLGWGAAQRDGTTKKLVSRVTRFLVKELGRETVIRRAKVRDTHLEEAGAMSRGLVISGHDEDLEKFEVEETLRHWIEKVEFSDRERQVYELDMRTDFDTKAIARELTLVESTVRGLRRRYQDKLRKVQKSA